MKHQFLLAFALSASFSAYGIANDYLQTVPLPGNECLASATVLRSGDNVAAGVDFTSNDILLMKLNSGGTIVKAQRLSGSLEDEAQAVLATSDGGAVAIGSTASFGEGNTDGFILKIREAGSIAWKRAFGTSGNEHFVRIVETSNRGFIVLGDADHDPNLNDIVIVQFNSRGRPGWRKTISAGTFDHASGMAATSDNGVIVAIAADFEEGTRSVLVKISSNGTIEWSRVYGTSDSHIALSAIPSSDGGYYFTEIFTTAGSQKSRTVLSKLDAAGIPVWSRVYKSSAGSLHASITSAADRELVLTGNITAPGGANSRGVLIGVDENGRILWRKRIRAGTRPVFIGQPLINIASDSILVAGCAGTRESNDMDPLILKLGLNGKFQGGCTGLTKFPLVSETFRLDSSEFELQEIPVPFSTANAGFNVTTFAAEELLVCSAE